MSSGNYLNLVSWWLFHANFPRTSKFLIKLSCIGSPGTNVCPAWYSAETRDNCSVYWLSSIPSVLVHHSFQFPRCLISVYSKQHPSCDILEYHSCARVQGVDWDQKPRSSEDSLCLVPPLRSRVPFYLLVFSIWKQLFNIFPWIFSSYCDIEILVTVSPSLYFEGNKNQKNG